MMPPPPPPPPEDRVSVEDGRYSPEPRDSPPFYVTLMNIVNTVTNLLLGAVALMAVMLANNIRNGAGAVQGSLPQHIYLCVTGYVIMMSQAILTISPFNGWTQALKFNQQRTAHWIMQVVGSTLAIAGSAVRIMDVNPNFSTTHGILGLVALVMTICSLLGGMVNLMMSKMQMKQSCFKILHSCFGVLTVAVAFICLAYGFDQDLYRAINGDINSSLGIALTSLALVGVVLSAFVNMFRRIFSC